MYLTRVVFAFVAVVSVKAMWSYEHLSGGYARHYTREVHIKQGTLRGLVVEPKWNQALLGVEKYLGLPYAAPPVGDMRFMPPGSAPQWHGTRMADTFGPVCPQNLPSFQNMRSDRREKFKKLEQLLRNQSEDCLYLNIYAPIQDVARGPRSMKYPVIVYIHGESYEWNSGNPYDGSVLASYGRAVVVTINYRLGILGFLRAGLSNQASGNFGLVDQVAALLWVQENISAFSGDPRAVTLMGHDTGAACINFLMVSPMAARRSGEELFHRAILMSGTALADWALSTNTLQVTTQVAQQLNCPLDDNGLAVCLRRKRLAEIMSVSVKTPEYSTRFGPTVDGLVIPNEPRQLMTVYNELFSRYELMYGVTEMESDHLLDAAAISHGLLERERDSILRSYLQTRFQYQPETALASTLSEYTDLSRASSIQHRDTVLEILSDARVAAPVVQTANYHSTANPKSYFYVYGHSTLTRKFSFGKSTHGEELPFIFGAPLDEPRDHFTEYSEDERLFSEAVMTYLTNFATTGNPNAPHKNSYMTMSRGDWMQYEVDWPEYDVKNQSYMLLTIPPLVGLKYRQQLMQYWNEILPSILKNITSSPRKHKSPITSFQPLSPPRKNIPPWINHGKPLGPPPFSRLPINTNEPVYGNINFVPSKPNNVVDKEDMMGIRNSDIASAATSESPPDENVTLSTAMNAIIIIGAMFLLANAVAFAGLYYKKRRLKTQEINLKRQYEDANLEPNTGGDTLPGGKKPKLLLEMEQQEPETVPKGCNVIMKMIRQSTKSEDTYEAVKASEGSSNQRFKLTRQISSSTLDPHTKVRDWIAHEIVHRCSPRFLRRTRQQFALEHKQKESAGGKVKVKTPGTTTLASNSTTGQVSTRPVSPECKNSSTVSSSNPQKPKKVSVAIDATPAARSSSVLKQEPIELSKSLDKSSPPAPGKMRRSMTMEDFTLEEKTRPPLRRQSSIIDIPVSKIIDQINDQVIKIQHHHSKSDPVQMNPEHTLPRLKTFDANRDINVTCIEEKANTIPLSPEEALQTIKRRNFPKVLPDFPTDQASHNSLKRRSLPPHNLLNFNPLLPENKLMQQFGKKLNYRIPPAPPPRTSSTLGRKPTNTSHILTQPSPVKIAEEPPVPPEPTITSNTLHVGPLIPSKSSLKKMDLTPNPAQPIYDNLRPVQNLPVLSKGVAKTIVTADPEHPLKRLEPKVIIKPSTSTIKRDPSKINKVIPRVVAKDNATDEDISKTVLPKPVAYTVKNETVHNSRELSNVEKSASSSSDSSNSNSESSDTGTVVKRQ